MSFDSETHADAHATSAQTPAYISYFEAQVRLRIYDSTENRTGVARLASRRTTCTVHSKFCYVRSQADSMTRNMWKIENNGNALEASFSRKIQLANSSNIRVFN